MNDQASLISLVENLPDARVLCVGDVILDHFHYGSVDRISPEAPIPVLKMGREDTMLGGAGNVVRNLVGLKASVRFVSVVGNDHDGRDVERLFTEQGVSDIPLIDHGRRRTSSKTRFLADGQQMLRADRETVFPLGIEMETRLIDAATAALTGCNVLVLSDYKKGVLSRNVIETLIDKAHKTGAIVVVDPKGSDYSLYNGADVLTPNRRELLDATALPVDSNDDIIAAAKKLISDHQIGSVLVTRSKDGMTLVTDGEPCHLGAEAKEVFDVSGAGDTVVATLAAALSAGSTLEQAARLANITAGIVVGKVGTAVAFAGDVISALHHQDLSSTEAKVMPLSQAIDRIDQWRRRSHTIGFTNGCFDLLHPGHISLLKQATQACDRLVIGINSDSSIKRLKGKDRPVQSEAARAAVMASLSDADLIIIFSEDTPLALIEAIKPDVLVKGADYTVDTVVGADIVHSYGGRVILAELSPGHSTTATIARLAGDNT